MGLDVADVPRALAAPDDEIAAAQLTLLCARPLSDSLRALRRWNARWSSCARSRSSAVCRSRRSPRREGLCRGRDLTVGGWGGWTAAAPRRPVPRARVSVAALRSVAMPFSKNRDVKKVERWSEKQERRERIRQALNPTRTRTDREDAKWMCGYLLWEVENILQIDRPHVPALGENVVKASLLAYRKQLLLSLLDTVALHRYASEPTFKLGGDHGKRWVRFLTEDCGWADGRRVSLQVLMMRFLHRSFEKSNPTDFSYLPTPQLKALNKYVQHPTSWNLAKRLADGLGRYWDAPGKDIPARKIDPFIDELMPLAETDFERDLIGRTTWAHLLYQMRNFRVHESRNVSRGIDLVVKLTTQPVYHMFGDAPDLHLVMHQDFVALLVCQAIYALQDHLFENDLNPYDNLRDTSAWEVKEFTPLYDVLRET